jgi:hypothetical protein
LGCLGGSFAFPGTLGLCIGISPLYEKVYKEAQIEITKRLLKDKYKIQYVEKWTGLSIAKVVLVQYVCEGERMNFFLNKDFLNIISKYIIFE